MWNSEKAEKDKFAVEWLRQSDPFKAAIAVTGTGNAGKALMISSQWINDPYVLNKKAELIEAEGEESFLPSKAELARRVWEIGETARTADDRTKAFKLYAEIMGHIAKPETNVNLGSGIVAIPVDTTDMKA